GPHPARRPACAPVGRDRGPPGADDCRRGGGDDRLRCRRRRLRRAHRTGPADRLRRLLRARLRSGGRGRAPGAPAGRGGHAAARLRRARADRQRRRGVGRQRVVPAGPAARAGQRHRAGCPGAGAGLPHDPGARPAAGRRTSL
ncbi:MAG: hypothetical protein AVDCRST_MAG07-2798, partial [uncultured Frankineae bacterium]